MTVGSLIGVGGLGEELNDAFNSYFKAEALTAAVLCVVLALVADLLIVGVGWLLMPWRHGRPHMSSWSQFKQLHHDRIALDRPDRHPVPAGAARAADRGRRR